MDTGRVWSQVRVRFIHLNQPEHWLALSSKGRPGSPWKGRSSCVSLLPHPEEWPSDTAGLSLP